MKKLSKKQQENEKLKEELIQVREETKKALKFLFDIGTKKHRAKYKGSNKDLMANREDIINWFVKETTSAALLRHLCKGKARCRPFLKKKIFDEGDKLLEEFSK